MQADATPVRRAAARAPMCPDTITCSLHGRQVSDWNFTADDIFIEIFDLDADPGQLVNLVNVTPAEQLSFYKDAARRQFACSGETCVW